MSAKPSVALPILWFTKHRDKAVTFIKNFLISLEHDQSHHDKIRRLMIELKKKKTKLRRRIVQNVFTACKRHAKIFWRNFRKINIRRYVRTKT